MSVAGDYTARWREALAGQSVAWSDYHLGGWVVRLHHHSPELAARFLPAFAHRALQHGHGLPIQLHIHLTDGSTSLPLPALPWGTGAELVNGVAPGYADDAAVVVFDSWSRLLHVVDFAQGTAFFHAPVAGQIPAWEEAAPLRVILNLWALAHEGHLLHGAALGDERGALLLAGPGGSGKSTCALQWLSQGGGYLSDDYCLVAAGASVQVHSLFCSAKVVPEDRGKYLHHGLRFSSFREDLGEKPAAILHPAFASQLIATAPLRAIVLPRLTGRSGLPELTRCEGGLAWRALALPTFSQLAGGGRKSMEFLSRFVKRLPCYQLDLGGPPEAVPVVLRQFLDELI